MSAWERERYTHSLTTCNKSELWRKHLAVPKHSMDLITKQLLALKSESECCLCLKLSPKVRAGVMVAPWFPQIPKAAFECTRLDSTPHSIPTHFMYERERDKCIVLPRQAGMQARQGKGGFLSFLYSRVLWRCKSLMTALTPKMTQLPFPSAQQGFFIFYFFNGGRKRN